MVAVRPWLSLLAFIPDWRLQDIESMGIDNVIHRCGSPIGDLSPLKWWLTLSARHAHQTQEESDEMPGVHGAHRELRWAHGFCH